jgi:hypothetical protein
VLVAALLFNKSHLSWVADIGSEWPPIRTLAATAVYAVAQPTAPVMRRCEFGSPKRGVEPNAWFKCSASVPHLRKVFYVIRFCLISSSGAVESTMIVRLPIPYFCLPRTGLLA